MIYATKPIYNLVGDFYIYIGDLNDKVTLDVAKPMLVKLGRDRVQCSDITAIEEKTLQLLVISPDINLASIAEKLNKTSQYIGRIFLSLINKGLISFKKVGREKIYTPSIDAVIAYTDIG